MPIEGLKDAKPTLPLVEKLVLHNESRLFPQNYILLDWNHILMHLAQVLTRP
jgi:hypothetical protein